MPSQHCEVRAIVDGKSVHVRLLFAELNKIGSNSERDCVLYQCPNCETFWELCAFQKAARELSKDEVKKYYSITAD